MKVLLIILSFLCISYSNDIKYKEAVTAFNNGDCEQAYKLYNNLVSQKHADSIFNYGWMYEKGQCVEQDYKKARELYEMAINSDSKHAKRLSMYRLGLLLLTARGSDDVSEDDKKRAISLWNESEKLGYAQASMALGMIYLQGSIIQQDNKKAREYFSKACSKNIKESCAIIANLKVE